MKARKTTASLPLLPQRLSSPKSSFGDFPGSREEAALETRERFWKPDVVSGLHPGVLLLLVLLKKPYFGALLAFLISVPLPGLCLPLG
jgi:hypothetical protein